MDDILTICQNVSDYIGLARPASIVGGTTIDQRRFQSAVHRSAVNVVGDGWPELLRVGSITFAAPIDDYALPDDLHHFVADTMWTSTQRIALGPIDPTTFSTLR